MLASALPIYPRRQKLVGLPASHGMDRNQRVRLKVYARHENARRRIGRQHIGPLTRAGLDVLHALLNFANSRTGSCFPSYEAIARAAGCAVSTIAPALRALEILGVVTVANRVRAVGRLGKVWRTSNAYVFRLMQPYAENRPGTRFIKDSRDSIEGCGAKPDPKAPLELALARFAAAVKERSGNENGGRSARASTNLE